MNSTAVTPTAEDGPAAEEICLLARIGVGDREALRDLYTRYGAPLFSLALKMVGDAATAEEVLQDAFVKIWRAAGSFDPAKARPFTWAVTILRHTAIDYLRKRPPANEEPVPSDVAMTDSPRQAAIRSEETERVRAALAGLPILQRTALDLAIFSGLTHAEIARRLAQPVGTIKTWIRRGLLDLRATLNASEP